MSADIKTDKKGRRYIESEIRWADGKTETRRSYEAKCIACRRVDFLVPEVEMCGPCTFGEADTAGGNW